MKCAVLILAGACLVIFSCATRTDPIYEQWEKTAARQKIELQTAREAYAQLTHAMTRDQVRALMGDPNTVEGTVLGAETQSGPWTAIKWQYSIRFGVANPHIGYKVYELYFANVGGQWVLNNWTEYMR